MMTDFQNPNNTQYRAAHVYFTEGLFFNIPVSTCKLWLSLFNPLFASL